MQKKCSRYCTALVLDSRGQRSERNLGKKAKGKWPCPRNK